MKWSREPGKLMLKPLWKRKEKKKAQAAQNTTEREAKALLALANMQLYYETSVVRTAGH